MSSKLTKDPTTQQAESCARLANTEVAFVELLKKRRDFMLNKCATLSELPALYRAQGRVQELEQLLELIEDPKL